MTTMMLMMTMTQHGAIKKFNARLNKQILTKYDILYISWIFYQYRQNDETVQEGLIEHDTYYYEM